MSKIDDIEIIDRVLSGDVEAYSHIVERYQNMTYRYVYSRFNNYDEVMDITQDIFIMALEALKTFRRESKFSTWFYSIMVNYCKNYKKKSWRHNTVSINGGSENDEYEIQIADEHSGPEESVIKTDSMNIVKEEVYKLPDDYREVVILRDIEGMSYNDIADIIGINLSNVKVRIHRGRELLKNRLVERGLI